MRNNFYKVLKNTIIYGLGKSSLQIVGFVLLPLYTRFLTPSDYGVLSLINFFTGFLFTIFVLGTSTSVFRFYLESDEIEKKSEACYGSLLMVFIWSFIIIMMLFPYKEFLSNLLFGEEKFSFHLMIGICTTACIAISSIPMFIIRAEDRAGLFIINNFLRMIIRVTLGITFVVVLNRGVVGALEAAFITSIIFALYLILYIFKRTKFAFSFNVLIDMLKYGFPLVIHGLGWIIINASDKYMLKEFSNLDQVGIYSVGYTMGYGVMIIVGSFSNAWPQMMFSYKDDKSAGNFFGKTLTYYIAIMSIIWMGIALFSEEIVILMTHEKFWNAHKVIPLISLAYIIHGAFIITSSGIYTKAKTHIEFILTPLTVGFCLIINFFFISKWGMMGASWATLINFSFQFILYTVMASRYIKINIEWGSVLKVIITVLPLVYSASFFQNFQIWIMITLKILIFILTMVIYNSRYFFNEEITFFMDKIKSKLWT